MLDNTALFQQLLSSGEIAMENAPFLAQMPDALPDDFDFERVEGMLLGLAVGDALGNTTESQLPGERRKIYGEIRDYLPNHYCGMREAGVPSDDTQMAFWTLEQLLADGGLIPDHLASKFAESQIFGIGQTVRQFLSIYKLEGRSWLRATQHSAGNGALMRVAPVLIPHLRSPSCALWADATLAGALTHNDRASNACCVSFISILWECLRLKQVPDPAWWLDTFVQLASQLEGPSKYSPRNNNIAYEGPLCRFVDSEVRQAIEHNWSTQQACDRWYSGAYLLETMPCALYILAKYAADPEEAIVRAVNDTKDNDTIAAIVGAAVGALHGRAGFPARWIENLLGRLSYEDDGHVFALIENARQIFWSSGPYLRTEEVSQ